MEMRGKKLWFCFTVCLVFQITHCDHQNDHDLLGSERRQDLSDNVIVSQVAEALAKGLEDSLKDCKIDPDNPDESLRKCMEERDAAKAKKLQEEFHGEQHDQSKHYKLLKTALLNLNEQMKETNSSSEEEISELLSKLDLVVRLLDVKAEDLPEVQSSTLVEVPTETEIEEAVVMQDYEHHHVDFWDTLFGLSDKVALGLLLTIKSVPREEAKDHLRKFLEGTDEDRLRILGDTLNLQRLSFQSDLDKAVEELSDIAKEEGVKAEKRVGAGGSLETGHANVPVQAGKKEQGNHPKKVSEKDIRASKHTHRSSDAFDGFHTLKNTPTESLDPHLHGLGANGHRGGKKDAEESSLQVNFAFVCSLFALICVAIGLYLIRSKLLVVGRLSNARPTPGYKRVYSKGF